MLKSLFGGGAVLTAALLLCSLNFYSQTLIAGNNSAIRDARAAISRTIITASHESNLLSGSLGAAMPFIAIAGVSEEAAATATSAAATTAPAASPRVKTETESLAPASAQRFMATAYALPGRTASGQPVRRGLIAADHSLPLGTRVRLDAGNYSGEYLVADRGGKVRGRIIDIWVPSNGEAIRFGRRPVKLTILSYGAKKAKRAPKTR